MIQVIASVGEHTGGNCRGDGVFTIAIMSMMKEFSKNPLKYPARPLEYPVPWSVSVSARTHRAASVRGFLPASNASAEAVVRMIGQMRANYASFTDDEGQITKLFDPDSMGRFQYPPANLAKKPDYHLPVLLITPNNS